MDLYSFIFRGELIKTELEKLGVSHKKNHISLNSFDEEIYQRLPLKYLDDDLTNNAQKMASVYVLISAFENTVREFINNILLEQVGENWWQTCVSEKIQKSVDTRIKQENSNRWHGNRGLNNIDFVDFGQLADIISNNWETFSIHIVSIEWVRFIFNSLEKSRNVIMHSGQLKMIDIERTGMLIRDWIHQVGI